MSIRPPLKVFITVDTEVWPRSPRWRETSLKDDLQRDIFGSTRKGAFGIQFQLDVLDSCGLKAVFFVESLFASVVGIEPLRMIVRIIRDRGHDVQLHVHSEWLRYMEKPILGSKTGNNMNEFSYPEQDILIREALRNLRDAGAPDVRAFRAGNYGANNDTLHVLRRNGILFDSSYNACYLQSDCRISCPATLSQPQPLQGIYEFPVSFFQDRPRHFRHAQLCACSAREFEVALDNAWKLGWHSFVIVSHGFELLRDRKRPEAMASPNVVVIRRFKRLCRFLAAHRDRFETGVFANLSPDEVPAPAAAGVLRSRLPLTLGRYAEQALGEWL